jgi:hypothetical protein
VSLTSPLSSATVTYPIEGVLGGWYYVVSVMPSELLGLAPSVPAPTTPGSNAVSYAILFQTSQPNRVAAVRSAFETSGLPAVQVASLSPISSTIWQQSPLRLFPNETVQFQLNYQDLGAQQTNNTAWYTFRAAPYPLQLASITSNSPLGSGGPSILPVLAASSASASSNNLNAFLSMSETDGGQTRKTATPELTIVAT